MKIRDVRFIGGIEKIEPDNDNVGVHIELEDGRLFSILVATPNNIFWYMDNEGVDYYFGTPALYVRRLTPSDVRRALDAVVNENNGYWLEVYGSLQEERDAKDGNTEL
jgi:hypothetical protein